MDQPTSVIKHRRKRTLKFKTDHNFLNITFYETFLSAVIQMEIR